MKNATLFTNFRKLISVFFLLILVSAPCFTQSLVWEREFDVGGVAQLSVQPSLIDSDANIVSAFDPYPFMSQGDKAYIFKYDKDGNQ